MIDKVQKIRKEVEKLKSKLIRSACSSQIAMETRCKEEAYDEVISLLDSLQEEPVSVWHNMDEVPIKGEVIVVQTKDTFYGISVQKGGTTYKNKNKDRYVRWAYASDLLNLSNVQRTTKEWKEPVRTDFEMALTEMVAKAQKCVVAPWVVAAQCKDELIKLAKSEEPVSEELEEASKKWLAPQLDKSYTNYGEGKMMELIHFDGYAMLDAIEFGAKWQKTKDESTTEDLGEYINELSKQFPEVSFAKLSRIAVRVTKWQKQKDEKAINENALLYNARLEGIEIGKAEMKQQMMAKAIDAEVLENYDGKVIKYDETILDEKLSDCKVFDKVKVILIKED